MACHRVKNLALVVTVPWVQQALRETDGTVRGKYDSPPVGRAHRDSRSLAKNTSYVILPFLFYFIIYWYSPLSPVSLFF